MESTRVPESVEPSSSSLHIHRLTVIISFLALGAAVAAIAADLAEVRTVTYLFKPITLLLIILLALMSLKPPSRAYKRAIIVGLILSLAGDVLLMLPQDLFIFGLASFLLAQVVYTSAFVSGGGLFRSLKALIPFGLYGLGMIWFLWPELGGLILPVLVYLIVIVFMAWQALGQWQQTDEKRALLAFIGALLFVLSDSALAINRFGQPFTLAPLFVLGTYYPAQWLIAMSSGSVHP